MSTRLDLPVSELCAKGMHNWCVGVFSCGCTTCHLGPCDVCKMGDLQNIYTDPSDDSRRVCALCYRKIKARQPVPETLCDDCGKPGAFRNPKTRKTIFRCAACHFKSGEVVQLHGGTNKLLAPCTGLNIDDDRHTWVHVKGTRFRCLCGTDKYDANMRQQMRNEFLRDS